MEDSEVDCTSIIQKCADDAFNIFSSFVVICLTAGGCGNGFCEERPYLTMCNDRACNFLIV